MYYVLVSITWRNRTCYISHYQATCCNQNLQKRGVCIFLRKVLYFGKINILHNCKEKNLEVCAVELETKSSTLIILSSYRVHMGDFNQFMKNLYDTLKHMYKFEAEFLICGDITRDYLTESNKKPTSHITYNIQSVTYH